MHKALLLKKIPNKLWQPFKEEPVLIIAVLAFVLAWGVYKYHFQGGFSTSHVVWSEFGSYFGGLLSPVFAFLAFVVLVRTLRVNQKELSDTRDVINHQIIESSFFELMSFFKQVISDLDNGYRNKTALAIEQNSHFKQGESLLRAVSEEIESTIAQGNYYGTNLKADFNDFYRKKLTLCPALNIFFNAINTIFEHIKNSNASGEKKLFFIQILYSFTPKGGLVLALAHAFSDSSSESFKRNVEEFELLSYLEKQSQLGGFIKDNS